MRVRSRRCIAVAVVGLSLVAHVSRAQVAVPADTIGPRGGTWGAETSIGVGEGVSLLRFSSPRAAWLLGAQFIVIRNSNEQAAFSGIMKSENTTTWVDVRAGRRWWTGESNARLQPMVGLGVGVGLGIGHGAGLASVTSSSQARRGSAYGELGATYFFSPHLSLGAAGELLGEVTRDRTSSSGVPDVTAKSVMLRGSLAHLTAAVYF